MARLFGDKQHQRRAWRKRLSDTDESSEIGVPMDSALAETPFDQLPATSAFSR